MNEIINYLSDKLQQPLPGSDTHKKMASYVRITAKEAIEQKIKAKLSAILILLYPDNNNQIHTVLMQRPESKGIHSAQMAFPGGRKEPEDQHLGVTALRETEEEIGVAAKDITLLGELTKVYIPPSNYIVAPYIGYVEQKPEFVPNPKEVAAIISTPLDILLDKANIKTTILGVGKKRDIQLEVPYFDVYGKIVWGATAMIISEFCTILEEYNLF